MLNLVYLAHMFERPFLKLLQVCMYRGGGGAEIRPSSSKLSCDDNKYQVTGFELVELGRRQRLGQQGKRIPLNSTEFTLFLGTVCVWVGRGSASFGEFKE